MNADKHLIMVIKRELLFNDDYFEGFRPHHKVDYESRILNNYKYRERTRAEKDPSYKQPIGYAMVVNPELKQVFAYRRAWRDGDYDEKRLRGKWSWGVGGHIEETDTRADNPIRESLIREIKEEIQSSSFGRPEVLGYVNDDSDEVGTVHFGILYLIPTRAAIVLPASPEIAEGKLRTIDELDVILSLPDVTVEKWSKISLSPLKAYLGERPAQRSHY